MKKKLVNYYKFDENGNLQYIKTDYQYFISKEENKIIKNILRKKDNEKYITKSELKYMIEFLNLKK